MQFTKYRFKVQPYLAPNPQGIKYNTSDYHERIVEARNSAEARTQLESQYRQYGAEIGYLGEVR